jgi:hypothetical protein
MSDLAARIEAVYDRIKAAARRAGRDPGEITLVAVTKTHPVETVARAYQAGLVHFGENRVEEATQKITEMAQWSATSSPSDPGEPPQWHFVGHLQRRKVNQVLGQYRLIHSVDSLKLGQRLDRLAQREKAPPEEILLECNLSGETAKYGFDLNRWSTDKRQFNTFLEAVAQLAALDRVVIRGLMTMAPLVDDPEEARPIFQGLAALRKSLQKEMPHVSWDHLSMGMTDDFEVAIEEGATLIRVGRAIFGERSA